jgi:MYXO-CTERM domain-containing protein
VTTDRRALAGARFLASHALPGLSVQDIRLSAGETQSGTCRVDVNLGGVCDFTDLPAFTRVSVTVTYLALQGSWSLDPVVSVSAAGDVVSSNNAVTAHVETLAATDLELRVDGSLAGSPMASLSFPLISVVNGGEEAFGARLDVTLPSQVTLVSVSASSATCSGTTVLRCDFPTLPPGTTATVALVVRAKATGSFVSALKLSANNDSNPANDTREVSVEITGTNVAAVSESSAAGNGGGGRIEFWMLGLLALLALRRYTALRNPVFQ